MQRRLSGLGGLAKRISGVHPLTYIFFYLLMAPSFAILYFSMPSGSFYAPYARLEPIAASDLGRTAAMIEGALRRSLGSKTIVIDGWKLARLVVYGPQSKDGSTLEFNIMGTFEKSNGGSQEPNAPAQGEPVGVVLPVFMPAGAGILIGPRPDETANIGRPVLLDVSRHSSSFQNTETEFYRQLLPISLLVLTPPEGAALSEFFDGLQGNPTAIGQAFFRMLYFSAIVQTTVGFGDIVPMTPSARFLVAVQAVFGVVFAGLFLNAVAYRASRPDQ
jgi:hypothetical protein